MSESEPTPNPIEAAAHAVTGTATPKAPQGDPAAKPASAGDGETELERTRAALKSANKEAEKFRLRLKEIEDRDLTALERAQKAAADAQAEAQKVPEMVSDQLRGHLTAIHGISEEDRDLYLTSNDPATLLKQAVGIASRAQTQTATTPKPDLTQGAQNPLPLNGDGLTEALARAVGAS